MIMERQGILVIHNLGNSRQSGDTRMYVIAFLAVLFFVCNGWAVCRSGSYTYKLGNTVYCGCDGSSICANKGLCTPKQYGIYLDCRISDPYKCQVGTYCGYYSINNVTCTRKCDTQREADSTQCLINGMSWVDGSCLDNSLCDDSRSQCEAASGTFSGSVISYNGQACCSAECNLCSKSAMERRMAQKIALCCRQGMAPPGKEKMCQTPVGHAGFKCGMVISQVSDEAYDWSCRDPGLDEENFQSYIENCEGGSSDSQNSSSSTGGSSSGTGESSSGTGPYPEGCEECPWLDSILDTLIAIKGKVDGIEECVTDPLLCMNVEPSEGDSFDYGYLDSIIVLLDSSLKLDISQRSILGSMDTTLLKMLLNDSLARKIDSAMKRDALKNDTNLRRTMADGNYTSDTNFRALREEIYHLDTATISHLDSIIKHLPDSILDSIRKYQDSALDRFDSALWGKGVGFSLIDSMVDSVVKYFQVSNHYDSMYAIMFGDTMSKVMEKLENLSFGIDGNLSFQVELDYGPLGYGDTATVTLRDDMNRMREDITNAILDIDTSVGNDLKELVEEQKGFYIFSTGYGVSGSSTLKDDINNIAGDLVRKLDSTWSQGNADTGAVNVQIGDGNLTADSIANEYGFNKINFARDTAAVVAAERAQLVEDSTSMCLGDECVYYKSDKAIDDSLRQRMQSASDSIVQWNEEFYRDSMDGIVDRVVRTLDSINPFGVFDSTLVKTLGMKIPNTNTCPEHCSKFKVDLPFAFGLLPVDLDFGMCTPYVVMGNQNVLSFLRFVIRCVVAVMCIGLVVTNLPRSI